MTLAELKKIKIEYMKARNADAVTGLNTVISRLMLLDIEKRAAGEELLEADVFATIKKVVKDLTEERDSFKAAGRDATVKEIECQIAAVEQFLPKMLSQQQIVDIIATLPDKSVPSVMKHFKTNYPGLCDMKFVSNYLKTLQG